MMSGVNDILINLGKITLYRISSRYNNIIVISIRRKRRKKTSDIYEAFNTSQVKYKEFHLYLFFFFSQPPYKVGILVEPILLDDKNRCHTPSLWVRLWTQMGWPQRLHPSPLNYNERESNRKSRSVKPSTWMSTVCTLQLCFCQFFPSQRGWASVLLAGAETSYNCQPRDSQPPPQRRTDWHTLHFQVRNPKKGSDWPRMSHVPPLGQSPMYGPGARALYIVSGLWCQISQQQAGARNPLGGQHGRDEKGGKSHSHEKGDVLGALAFIYFIRRGRGACKEASLRKSQLVKNWGLPSCALLTSGPDAGHHCFRTARAALTRN